jgi:spore germination protein PB
MKGFENMKFHIHQTITINMIKIQSISNSSVFQIGTSGIIKPFSTLSNSGGFTQVAPLPVSTTQVQEHSTL